METVDLGSDFAVVRPLGMADTGDRETEQCSNRQKPQDCTAAVVRIADSRDIAGAVVDW